MTIIHVDVFPGIQNTEHRIESSINPCDSHESSGHDCSDGYTTKATYNWIRSYSIERANRPMIWCIGEYCSHDWWKNAIFQSHISSPALNSGSSSSSLTVNSTTSKAVSTQSSTLGMKRLCQLILSSLLKIYSDLKSSITDNRRCWLRLHGIGQSCSSALQNICHFNCTCDNTSSRFILSSFSKFECFCHYCGQWVVKRLTVYIFTDNSRSSWN